MIKGIWSVKFGRGVGQLRDMGFGGFDMIRTALTALAVGSAWLVFAPTQASADAYVGGGKAGGDCCADLEERVAELEATTVRKGNKKVTVELSGQVNKGVLFWDDGDEKNVYVVDNDHSNTRFRIKGKAKISDNWESGYHLELGVEPAESSEVNQFDDNTAGSDPLQIRHSYMYIKNKKLGAVSIGLQNTATKDIAKEDAAGLGYVLTPDYDNARSFFFRPDGFKGSDVLLIANTEIGDISGCYGETGTEAFDCSARTNNVRYISPEVWGFFVDASWGEDDIWDVALKLDKEIGKVKVKGGIGYQRWRDERELEGAGGGIGFQADREEILGSISAWHTPSGLFGLFAAVHSELDDSNTINAGVLTNTSFPEGESYHFQGGIKKKWWETGHTAVFGYYNHIEDMLGGFAGNETRNVTGNFGPFLPLGSGIVELTGAEVEGYGFGVAQDLDSAALNLYALFSWYEGEVDLLTQNNGRQTLEFEDFFTGIVGGRISF